MNPGLKNIEKGGIAMSTKGASNHYGGSKNGRQGKPTQHTGFAWAKDFNSNTLSDHFNRHGDQMGCKTKESYAASAVKFANKVDRKNCVSFVDKRGSTYKYNKKTNTLVIVKKDGYVITYFKPAKGYDYYLSEKKGKAK